MLRRRSLVTLIVSMALGLATFAVANSGWPSPRPYAKFMVYTANGVYDPAVPPAEGDLAEWFHRDILGRSDREIAAARAAADAYFISQFGSVYTPGSLMAFGLDPRVGYTAHFISGEDVPPEGWVVRAGGFLAFFSDGSYGMHGDYSVDVRRRNGRRARPIRLHFETVDAIRPNEDGTSYFRCRLKGLSFFDFGGGMAQGLIQDRILPDGRLQAIFRNVATFPGTIGAPPL